MHSLRWAPISYTNNLGISSNGTKETHNKHWVNSNVVATCSKPTKIGSNWANFGSRCRYLRYKTSKVVSSQEEGNGETAPDAEDSPLSGLVEEEVEELLKTEENQALLKDLASSMQRVNSFRKELEDIDNKEKDAAKLRAYVQRLEGTNSLIADFMREVSEAEAKMQKAELALVTTRAGSSTRDLSNKWGESEIDEDAERMESIKALTVSALVGTFASIPIALFQAESIGGLFIREAIVFISCALFGVTYRYTVRRNLENIQLKTGTVVAFGLVRGLSRFEAELPVDFDVNAILLHAPDAAFMVGEGILVFIAAAIALDYFMKIDLLSPFPSKKNILS
ncbi:hypothetical protein SUGI_1169360 [Cryptomeria japonica]|uniref:uncharacterized protein LOC131068815 n=1 Tax=Cryptomeria japonica TaxID=3369 RepID=UPI002414BD00|nr:uncharacterized protein LOC131068815 [Cryptomeria japonica]GLJ54444.1 hypothetical protein SUGI_1169360 [Cryptomeria japonica]